MIKKPTRESELGHLEAVSWGEEVDSSFLLFGEMPVDGVQLSPTDYTTSTTTELLNSI